MKYYLLSNPIHQKTDKAFAIEVGTNGCITKSRMKIHLEWIAYSQVKQLNNNIYIPAWIVINNELIKKAVNFDEYIEVEENEKPKRQHKTKEQKELYNNLLNSHFNGNIPDEYIEYWFEEDISDTRFTTMDRLENRLQHDEIIKLNIVRNGVREIIRG